MSSWFENPDESFSESSANEPNVLSVSEFTQQIKLSLEGEFPQAWVSGEISNLSRPRSGHLYFDLKDERAVIKSVMWRSTAARLKFDLADGDEVVCSGGLDVYPPHGTYKLIVRRIEPLGVGPLQKKFEQLYQKLTAEGLFAAERKKPLPRFPKRVGFVTSPTGAAIHDFLQTLRRRWPGTRVLVIPARVQGIGAAQEIADGIELANMMRPALDLIVVGRGGGSIEDLWAFNEEQVVRAIFNSRLPIVSAVGHEVDVTLSDLVADVRALTPTAAAELIVPSADDFIQSCRQWQHRLDRGLIRRFESARQRLGMVSRHPVMRQPLELVRRREERLDELARRSDRAIKTGLERTKLKLGELAGKLNSLSPLAVLSRGYAVVQTSSSQELITNVSQLRQGDHVDCRIESGTIKAEVIELEHEDQEPS